MSVPPCAACKFLRRKCKEDCIFAPYFPPNDTEKYKTIHKVYGPSHVATLLKTVEPNQRQEAVTGLVYEAERIVDDPVGGCSRVVQLLHRTYQDLETQIGIAKNEIAVLSNMVATTFAPPAPPVMYRHEDNHITNQQIYEGLESYDATENVMVQHNQIGTKDKNI
ncbi:unnamed protein product [Cochlearia groenlandica]